jgi:phage tail protein X
MSRVRKLATVAVIGSVATCAALPFFRRSAPVTCDVRPRVESELPWRERPIPIPLGIDTPSPSPGSENAGTAPGSGTADPNHTPRLTAPVRVSRPTLPPAFTTTPPLASTERATESSDRESTVPVVPAASARDTLHRHKIADGDTLATLAERYYGDAERSREIFEANREILSSPAVLPIGVEIVIPVLPMTNDQ